MEYNFDIEKIKYSSNPEIRKTELLKFLEFYFKNKRPKNFINYEKELTKFLPEIMSRMSFDQLLHIIPNYYQFCYTVTIEENFSIVQNNKQIKSQQDAHQHIRLQWDELDSKNAHSAAHYGTYAFKSNTILLIINT